MAYTQTKFQIYSQNIVKGVHNFNSNVIKVMLTNTAPNAATNQVLADITEISAGNGYTAGGSTTTLTLSNSSGTEKLVASNVTFTATGGTIGPFRYVVIYDSTPTSPLKPLITYLDYATNLTLNSGDTFTVNYDATNGWFQVA